MEWAMKWIGLLRIMQTSHVTMSYECAFPSSIHLTPVRFDQRIDCCKNSHIGEIPSPGKLSLEITWQMPRDHVVFKTEMKASASVSSSRQSESLHEILNKDTHGIQSFIRKPDI